MSESELSELLENTLQPHPLRPRKLPRRPSVYGWMPFSTWARSQVAAYRFGLVLGYLATIYLGMTALVAGVPIFDYTAPHGWAGWWGVAVCLGGLTAAIGAIHAGEEPATRSVRNYNRIELAGAIMLFLTLGSYAATHLILGYGYGDALHSLIGAGFVALGVHPAVRMTWLIFRPRKKK